MIYPELGHFTLALAMALSVMLALVPALGVYWRERLWIASAGPLATTMLGLTLASFLLLVLAFVTDDFSVAYVANHSNTRLPVFYKVSAVWGGHEGSILLWSLILTAWTAAEARFSRALPADMLARVLAVLGGINAAFFGFILFTSNPFQRLLPASPAEGADLNPLLQDFGLIVHPPILYMGYVGFSVAFAFAVAALTSGRLDAAWARWSRPWTTAAWAFLTLGIALGSWWAYYELGWGGWWFWDPVENASLMPWLAGTALIHSLAVTEKRGVFRSWTVLLALFTFSLSLLGTFLVRSGILTSVHAFANDPERGTYVLYMLMAITGSALLLFAVRAPVIHRRILFTESSRETFLLINNVLLVVATLTVLGGTLFPLLAEAFGKEISVGKPYFNQMFMVLTPLLAVPLGLAAYSQWKHTPAQRLLAPVPFIAGASTLGMVAICLWMNEFAPGLVIGLFVGFWILVATLLDYLRRTTAGRGLRLSARGSHKSLPARIAAGTIIGTRSYRGMVLGHVGLAVTILGATVVSWFSVEKDVRMQPGDQYLLGAESAFPVQVTFVRLDDINGPNFTSQRATFRIHPPGEPASSVELHPEKRIYLAGNAPMTEAAIDAGFWRDLYLSLGEPLPGQNAWAVRIQSKPLVRWIWLGALLMAAGGMLALLDPRYRRRLAVSDRSARPLQGVSHPVDSPDDGIGDGIAVSAADASARGRSGGEGVVS